LQDFALVLVEFKQTLTYLQLLSLGKYMQMANKRTTSFYLTDEALEALEQVCQPLGSQQKRRVEIAARLMRDNPSVFFRMIASNSIILPDDEEGPE
jgi:hypothetical protein